MLAKIMIGSVLLLSNLPVAHATDDAAVGSIVDIETSAGSAQVAIINGNTSGPAVKNSALKMGDHVVTGAETSVSILLNEGSNINIGPSSDFAVNSVAEGAYRATSLQLAYGFLHLVVKKIYGDDKSFTLRNGNSVMGVRGTEFFAEQAANGGSSSCHTLEGTVLMARTDADLKDPARSVTLNAGTMSQLPRNSDKPTAAAKFDSGQFLSAVAKRAPTLAKLRARTVSRVRAPLHRNITPAVATEDQKPKERPAPQRSAPKRHGH